MRNSTKQLLYNQLSVAVPATVAFAFFGWKLRLVQGLAMAVVIMLIAQPFLLYQWWDNRKLEKLVAEKKSYTQ